MKKIIGTSVVFLPSLLVVLAMAGLMFPDAIPEEMKNLADSTLNSFGEPAKDLYGFKLYFPKEICRDRAEYWMSTERVPAPYSMQISGVSLITKGKSVSTEGVAVRYACQINADTGPETSVMSVQFERKGGDTPTSTEIFGKGG